MNTPLGTLTPIPPKPSSARTGDARADLARLALAALLTLGVYALLWVAPFPLLRWYDVPLLDLGKLAGYGPFAAIALLAGYAVLFGAYLVAWRAASRLTGRPALCLVMGASIAFGLLLLWAYPVGADDIYDYIFRARLWGAYDYNPLTVTPLQVSDDPWFRYVVWVWFPSPYGPLWSEISLLLYRLAGDSLLANLLLFKLLAIGCTTLTSALLYVLLRARGQGAALGGVVLFAWNPLLQFESAVNGHNDTVMLLLLLVALWLYHRRRLGTACMLCVLAGLVKLTAFVALPVFLAAAVLGTPAGAQRVRRLLSALLVCLLTALCIYAPLWHGQVTLAGMLALDNRFTASLAAIVKLALEAWLGREPAESLTRALFAILFLGAYVLILRGSARRPVFDSVLTAVAGLLLVGTLWFQPWYVTWLIALAPLASPRWRRPAIVWSAGALGLYWLFTFAWNWFPDFFNAANGLVLNVCAAALWLVPVVLSLAAPLRGLGRLPTER